MKTLARPKTVVCHICGREFGRTSIDIHLPQCQKKWQAAEALKPARERRPVPKKPELEEGLTQEQANDAISRHWNDEVLAPCPNCGRTFLPDRLEVHLRSCRPKSPAGTRRQPSRGTSTRSPTDNASTMSPRLADSLASKTLPKAFPRPKTVVCHICGREFGSASIDIHVPKCEKKWEAAEAQKPRKERRPVPQKPDLDAGMTLEEKNETLAQHWNTEVLEPCPNCGRTFLPDRLEVHLRSCKPPPGSTSSGQHRRNLRDQEASQAMPAQTPPIQAVPRPRTVVCHICGREFGSASIDIHVPQCQQKWEATEAAKPSKERRPVPEKPDLDPSLSREEMNAEVARHWNDEVLEPCPTCGRTFLPDRLQVHLRSCGPKGATFPCAKSTEGATMRKKQPSDHTEVKDAPAKFLPRPRTVACHICGREFGTASIDIHIPQCQKKFEAAEAQKPSKERRPAPQRPVLEDGLSEEQANEVVMRHWNDEVLEACPNCGRTFLPDRLEVHLRSCRPKNDSVPRAVSADKKNTQATPADPLASSQRQFVRPRTIACHICGREFGTASIDIHLPKCEKKWELVEAQKPASQRRPVPQRPELDSALTQEEANNVVTKHWNDEVLEPCPNCGRTFLPDRLEVHLRSCRPKSPAKLTEKRGSGTDFSKSAPSTALAATSDDKHKYASKPVAQPRTVACHICGREFGSASINIHIPQCEKKWEAAQEKKPAAERRPIPQRPELDANLSRLEANAEVLQHWNDRVLEACPNCSRTFLPDRLEVHLRSCRPKSPKRSGEACAGTEHVQEGPDQDLAHSSGGCAVSPPSQDVIDSEDDAIDCPLDAVSPETATSGNSIN